MKDKKSRGLDELIPKESAGEVLSKSEVRMVLDKLDKLLGKLPDEDIEKFAKSKEYETYVKLLKSYDIK
jgi:hypothetical protein